MVSTFETRFGVRFGMLICFDVFQHFPSAAAREPAFGGVTDFVMSTCVRPHHRISSARVYRPALHSLRFLLLLPLVIGLCLFLSCPSSG